MPQKVYEIVISPATVIRVFSHTHLGRLIGFSVVLLFFDGDAWIDIGRFDSAHGTPHQDILGKRKGLRGKVWYGNLPSNKCLR